MDLYDSIEPAAIPSDVPAVAGYVDGIYGPNFRAFGSPYGWDDAAWARFSTPFKLRIATSPFTNDGHALDVEPTDATPQQAPDWVKARRAAGVQVPWVYCNRANRAAVEGALSAAGITADQAALWIATLDGTQSVPAGPYPIAAVQWASSAITGGHFDVSTVNAEFGAAPGVRGEADTLNQAMKIGLAKVAFCAIYNRQPSQQEEFDFANTLADDGSNFNTLCDQLSQNINNPDLAPIQPTNLRVDVNKALAATSDDDSAFVTKTALKNAIETL